MNFGLILLSIYVISSYWLFFYAAKHDARIRGTTLWDEMPPAVVLAPIFAPFLLLYIVGKQWD